VSLLNLLLTTNARSRGVMERGHQAGAARTTRA
jgi:hypothetical protein